MASTAPDPAVELLRRVADMKLLPEAAIRVRDIANDPDASTTDLADAAGLDPMLSARVLRMANSSVFNRGTPVTSLRRAVSVLGFARTRNLALGMAMVAIGDRKLKYRSRLWAHTTSVAAATAQLARFVKDVDPQTAFLGGLLHDLGVQVLLALAPDDELGLLARWPDGDPRLLKGERDRFGFDHARVGGLVADQYGLPSVVADAIRLHHQIRVHPGRLVMPGARLAAAVALAERLVQLTERGMPAPNVAGTVSMDPLAKPLGVSKASLQVAAEVFEEEAKALQSMLD